ncbi:MAG: enoyl-CoA hydratase-related protein [Acetobacteraceae bacterium]
MAETDDVLVSQQEGIVTVALNKPAKRNAVSFAMWRRLGELFTGFRERADVRVVILTGTEGNFSAGADISEFTERRESPDAAKAYSEAGRMATLAIRDLPQPTIAAAHGYCVGGGCGLALACDVRVGDATTKMGIPAAKRGIVYTVLDTENLMRAVGLSRAKLVLFTGRVFPMVECRTMGLLDEVSDAGALEGARILAREMAERAPLSQRGAKITMAAIARGEVAARTAEIAEAQRVAAASEDFREATQSFMEKRRPVFRGR